MGIKLVLIAVLLFCTSAKGNQEEALRQAAAYGDLKKVKALVNAGVDVRAAGSWGFQALHEAARSGHLEVVQYLVETCGVDPTATNSDGTQALHEALHNRQHHVVQYLSAAPTLSSSTENIIRLVMT